MPPERQPKYHPGIEGETTIKQCRSSVQLSSLFVLGSIALLILAAFTTGISGAQAGGVSVGAHPNSPGSVATHALLFTVGQELDGQPLVGIWIEYKRKLPLAGDQAVCFGPLLEANAGHGVDMSDLDENGVALGIDRGGDDPGTQVDEHIENLQHGVGDFGTGLFNLRTNCFGMRIGPQPTLHAGDEIVFLYPGVVNPGEEGEYEVVATINSQYFGGENPVQRTTLLPIASGSADWYDGTDVVERGSPSSNPDTPQPPTGPDPNAPNSNSKRDSLTRLCLVSESGPDHDNDGLSTAREQQLGTHPRKPDTDGDGYWDGDEVINGFNPRDATDSPRRDSDGDLLTNTQEIRQGTDPFLIDSDGDGYWDGEEVAAGTAPTNPNEGAGRYTGQSPDRDGDGLGDQRESGFSTDPTVRDTDGDGYWDADEVVNGFNPTDPQDYPRRDSDGDGLTNLQELRQTGTDPLHRDSNRDGVWDGAEARC